MASPSSRRQPISCENCRKRKIRCIVAGEEGPCNTCRHRGYSSTCWFKREATLCKPATGPSSQSAQISQLMSKISRLESLLGKNIEVTQEHVRQVDANRAPDPVSDFITPRSDQHLEPPRPSVSQAGRLVATSEHHVRYVPSSSTEDSHLLDSLQQPTFTPSPGFPFFIDAIGLTHRELLDNLPPRRQCDELISAFFQVFSPLFHVLHDPSFHSKYRAFQNDPHSVSLSYLALIFVCLALAVTALDDNDPLLEDLGREKDPASNISTIATRYRSAAMKCLVADNFMWQHNLCTVQALVLLVYALNHVHGPAWSLLGTTLHIAISIGCSVDPTDLNVDAVEREERRRCWAAIQMLYTIQNTCLGNITPFLIQSRVKLPADVDDNEVSEDGIMEEQLSDSRRPTMMSYILYKFRLYNLAFQICRHASTSTTPCSSTTEYLYQQILSEQRDHVARWANMDELPIYHVAHFYIISNYTNHLILLLHRPYLIHHHHHHDQPHEADNSSVSSFRRFTQESHERCENAALAIMSTFEKLHSDTQFKPYRWYVNGLGSFYSFLAMTTIVVLLGQKAVTPDRKFHMMNALQTCMARFRNTASRSTICSKGIMVLEPVIQELVTKITKTGEGSVGDNWHVSPATSSSDEQQSNGPISPSFHRADIGANFTGMDAIMDTDTDASGMLWALDPHLQSMISKVPCEQWLMPAGFPWDI